MKLTFLGSVDTVTGSKTLLETGGRRVLIDCGLFQGIKKLRQRNWKPLGIDPASLDAVILTHAHIDHSGYLPRLVAQGFRGPIHCTTSTRQLLAILLPDSGHLQEEQAAYANRRGFSRHHPALPLYTEVDAIASLRYARALAFGESRRVVDGLELRFRRAGHILGAAWLELEVEGRRVVFSGDLGRADDPLMPRPEPLEHTDVLVCESTYGDRRHPGVDVREVLADVLRRTVARGGVLVVPAFAVGRSQLLMHHLASLMEDGAVPEVPMFLNSPMATKVSELYLRNAADHRLDEAAWRRIADRVEYVGTVERSKALNHLASPAVIISASGMATGGRVVHAIKAYAPDPRNTILFAGYQAAGTRGAAMVGGAETVKIHGEHVPIAAEVVALDVLSAHADVDGLCDWVATCPVAPRHTFLNHGEPAATDALRCALAERFGLRAHTPDLGESFEID